MSTLVRLQQKGQITIPSQVRTAVGLVDGDLLDVRAVGGRIVITPQLVIDRSKLASADDEYTPEQRRMLDARLAEAEKGPYFGPFKNGGEIAAFLKRKPRITGQTKTKKSR